ncbi:precorrin-4 C(11)-methyltransferase [Desulfurivibrio alkaliphilus]|uniref:Precorrin-4 C11-methyltransferase n=1 Tax=Desulfurivibrio alkaliphilus (strain DSM 19089 / UNIQEM U267 / AHT2) TaxID=589865 RepID=D6Z406_DESAT|nr:precorrin-4 C(11)-methyltransferase [Desulfurivibrio alkaliphilus]ADH86281.1 precorrin-4 C11-methyltransferase [Desulfurivibrio alkaliphilus AHT 2]
MNNSTNIIHFVGAGPGDPELITVKGRRLLAEAELIVYTGSLVPETLLVGLTAEIHNSAGLTLDEVITLLAEGWRRGRRVVRLHTGDPAIYGAIGEQMARLGELDIPWRVVPGVSSVTAAAAALSAELTLPEVSQSVIITRRGGRTPVPEREQLPALAACQATMTILLSAGMMNEVTTDLLAGGYPPETPAAVVANASQPEERIVRGTLADIADKAQAAGITKTAIIVVGKVLTAGAPPVMSKLYDPDFSHGYR